jgi:hypothetical protein
MERSRSSNFLSEHNMPMTTGGVMEGIMNSTNIGGVRRGIFPSKHNSPTTTGGVMEGNLNSVNLGGVQKEKLNSGINESDLGWRK